MHVVPIAVLLTSITLPACFTVNARVAPAPLPAHARRQLQSRAYEEQSELEILRASVYLLQDLGFHIDESEPRLGVLVASKQRDAGELGQYLLTFFAAVLFGHYLPFDQTQVMRAAVVTCPSGPGRFNVRVNFLRVVWNGEKQVSKYEPLDEPEVYARFFALLDSNLFLEDQAP